MSTRGWWHHIQFRQQIFEKTVKTILWIVCQILDVLKIRIFNLACSKTSALWTYICNFLLIVRHFFIVLLQINFNKIFHEVNSGLDNTWQLSQLIRIENAFKHLRFEILCKKLFSTLLKFRFWSDPLVILQIAFYLLWN